VAELSVEGLQEALVISEPHLVLDELDLTCRVAHLPAEPACQGEEHEGVPLWACEVDLHLLSLEIREGFDCHVISII